MEKTMEVNGRQLNFATTYDGDSQYNVQVRSGEKLITQFKVSADHESDVYEEALAEVKANIELGNLKL
ncbi:hypothetical protein [Brevibacillus dissolubilis]|uniref:hypothetical protein n=1 Tax=Brevibacillus dissolubilis TaxID=1844116 RepID=UPI0011174A8E|nr:hypothetical protein [Brevibacillus dissolubilis]